MKTFLVFVSVLMRSVICGQNDNILFPDHETHDPIKNITKDTQPDKSYFPIKNSKNETDFNDNTSTIKINKNDTKLDNDASSIIINDRYEINFENDTSPISSIKDEIKFNHTSDGVTIINKNEADFNKFLPKDCGNVRATWRVESGVRQSEFYEFPFYVDLVYENGGINTKRSTTSTIHCGGTLINHQFVVTAASCVKSNPKIIGVRLGDHDLNTNPDCYHLPKYHSICAPPIVELNIRKKDIFVHNLYRLNSTNSTRIRNRRYDIALIKLPRKVNFTDAIEAVCLPINDNYRKQGNLTLVGFPQIEMSAPRNNTLLSSAVPHIKNGDCQILLNRTIREDYLCAAGENKKKYCYGYGGSGFFYVVKEEYRLRWILAAIVPYGMNICNEHGHPKVFPRMEIYNDWILETIQNSFNII